MKRCLLFALLVSVLWCMGGAEDAVIGEEDVEDAGADGVRSGASEGAEDVKSDSVKGGTTDNIIRLFTDEQSFDEAVKEANFMVIVFYTPWCHHCGNVLSVLSEVAAELQAQGVQFAKADIEATKSFKARFEITEVPDIRLLRRGVASLYTGPNEKAGKKALVDYFMEEAKKEVEEGVLELTEVNFDPTISATPLMLVEFMADWCVHCQQLEPHFQAAARRLRRHDPPILLGQVKVPDQLEVAKRYGVTGYPLLIVFRYGQQYNYTGPRDEEGIVQYMKRQTGPSSKFLSTVSEARAFSQSNTETRAIGFFAMQSKVEMERYMESGNQVRMDMELGHTMDEQIAEEMGFKVGTVVVFHSRNLVSTFEDGYSVIKSVPNKEEALTKLLLKHACPLVGVMTEDNQLTMYKERPLLVAYFELSWDLDPKNIKHWHNLIASVAKDFRTNKKQLSFAIADEQDFPTDLKVLGLSDWGEDVAVGIFDQNGVRYSLKEEMTTESLREFVEDFLSGDLKPHLNSEPVPKKPIKGSAIKKVVGSTFESFMSDKSKNRLIKLCMPGAPDCEKAKEYFPKVAARYDGMKEMVFGEINLALNDLPPGVTTDGEFPSFLFARQGSKDAIQVTPKPTDEADLIFFLKVRHGVRPTLTEKDVKLRAKYRKKGGKKDKKKDKKKNKDEL